MSRNQFTPKEETFSSSKVLDFIRKNASNHTADDLCKKIGCSRETVNSLCRKMRLRPLSGRVDNKKVAAVIEDYFYNRIQIKVICEKYNISLSCASRYIGKYMKQRTDDPVLMVLQSKINGAETE